MLPNFGLLSLHDHLPTGGKQRECGTKGCEKVNGHVGLHTLEEERVDANTDRYTNTRKKTIYKSVEKKREIPTKPQANYVPRQATDGGNGTSKADAPFAIGQRIKSKILKTGMSNWFYATVMAVNNEAPITYDVVYDDGVYEQYKPLSRVAKITSDESEHFFVDKQENTAVWVWYTDYKTPARWYMAMIRGVDLKNKRCVIQYEIDDMFEVDIPCHRLVTRVGDNGPRYEDAAPKQARQPRRPPPPQRRQVPSKKPESDDESDDEPDDEPDDERDDGASASLASPENDARFLEAGKDQDFLKLVNVIVRGRAGEMNPNQEKQSVSAKKKEIEDLTDLTLFVNSIEYKTVLNYKSDSPLNAAHQLYLEEMQSMIHYQKRDIVKLLQNLRTAWKDEVKVWLEENAKE